MKIDPTDSSTLTSPDPGELSGPRTGPGVDDPAELAREDPCSLLLVVGLGNPGREYANHRHNIGFRIVGALARNHGLSFARRKRAKAHVAEGQISSRLILLAKPRTFMNQSGKAVRRLSRAHNIPPQRILVVYDDLDLPLGRLRLRPEGGSGGHKGMRSIVNSLDTQAFPRLRVGIDRPPGRMDPSEYVLEPFGDEVGALVTETVARAVQAIECWIAEGIVAAMDEFNRPAPRVESSHREDRE